MRNGMVGVLVTLLVSISNIASAETVKDVKSIDAETHIIYGSIDLFDGGRLKRNRSSVLVMVPENASEALVYRATRDKDGAFFLSLEPGNYMLLAYIWKSSMTNDFLVNRYRKKFSVPQSGGDTYIGTFEVWKDGGLDLHIRDEFDRISLLYDERFPNRKGTSNNRTLDEPVSLGNFASESYQCSPEWGLVCDNDFQGVLPLSPTIRQRPGFFPRTENLRPEFSWEPVQGENISYDLALYEAASLNAMVGPGTLPGNLVAYVEDLDDPYWQPEAELKPNTRYYWTVRLRRGDKVSGWSTKGFSFFAVVAWAFSRGDYFAFRTP